MKTIIFVVGAVIFACGSNAQFTVQRGAGLHLQPNSFVTVEEHLESSDDVSGEGLFILNGRALQTVNFNGNKISGLLIENAGNVQLDAPISISARLIFAKGHLVCNSHTLVLKESASVEGGNPESFIVTSVTGEIRKEISSNLNNYFIPVGDDNLYAPLFLTTSGKYQHAFVEVSSQNKIHPNKPVSHDYLQQVWSVHRKGVDGKLQVKAIYQATKGTGDDLRGFYWNGLAWNDKQSQIDINSRTITVSAPEGKGDIYAFDPSDLNGDLRVSVFPNPAQSIATVQLNSKYDSQTELLVYDAYGQVVLVKNTLLKQGANQVRINVSGLAKGQYTIKITGMEQRQVISLIKG